MNKKLVKLLSVVMLLSMFVSMMTAGAYALVDDGNSSVSISIGGGSASDNSSSGNLTIGADQRPADDTPYQGTVEENTSTDYDTAIAEAKAGNAASQSSVDAQAAEIAKSYLEKADSDYSSIENSSLEMVQDNQDFLKYVHDNVDTIDEATLQTAVDLFGEDVVYGNGGVQLAENAEDDVTANCEAAQEALYAYIEAYKEANPDVADAQAALEEAQDPQYVELLETYLAYQQVADMMTEGDGIALMGIPDASRITSSWSSVCGTGSSLANAVQSAAELTFYNTFDICNSSDYRITINLRGVTIDATATQAAFAIRGKTITFTNGTIKGDGFYVYENGILNLGGLVNTTADITVNAKANAVYVANTGVCVIGQGTTLNGWYTYKDSNNLIQTVVSNDQTLKIASGGRVLMSGGSVNGGNSYTVYSNGGTFEISGSTAEINNKYNYPAIVAEGGSSLTMKAGTVYGSTGIAVKGDTTKLNVSGGSITGYLKPATTTWPNTGAAVTVYGDAKESGDSPEVYITAGTLRSEYTAGLINLTGDTTRFGGNKNDIKRITVDSVNVTIQEASGCTSDYAKVVFLVKIDGVTTGYQTLNEAIAAANKADKKAEITMLDNYTSTTTPTAINNTNGVEVVFNGNGHTIQADTVNGLVVGGGTAKVTIQNVNIDGNHKKSGIEVTGGVAYIGDEVYVDHFENGLSVTGGTVTVNGLDVDDDTDYGIHTTGGTTTVIMCKVDAANPVYGEGGTLKIEGGWFLYKAGFKIGPTSTATPVDKTAVASYVDPDVSYVKYVEADKYYEVLFNDTPTVEIVSGSTGYETDGTPYISYNKADPDPIVLNITPAVTEITAVSKTASKASYNLFTAEAGKSGNIRIADNAVLMDCPSGAYDLQFTFKNGYTIKNKLSFYVFPKIAKLFDVPNEEKYTLTMTSDLIDRLTSTYETSKYDVGSEHNIAVVMSETPDKISIGSDPNGTSETYLENYSQVNFKTLSTDAHSWSQITSGTYSGCYLYYISYADLNNLAPGQNYVFLQWDGTSGALKRMPLTVSNSSVSISPTTVNWSNVSTYANFTVKPSVDAVYIDGEKVDSAYWSYNTSNNVLSIKGSYLNALTNKEHTLEVVTPKGKVSATLNTGVGLVARNLDYHVYGGAKSLSFAASDVINQDAGIWIGASNPTRLDSSAYTWDSASGFTLNAAFLNRLSLGTYYISCYVYNGSEYEYTTTSFKVISATQASYTPSTGDNSNIYVWVAVLALSGVAITVIVLPRMRRKPNAGK